MPGGAAGHPQEAPPWLGGAARAARWWFVELAVELTVFDCVRLPLLPGLRTRTGMFVFVAPLWLAVERDPASCLFPAAWVAVWMPPKPPWFWLELWSAPFEFDADASEVAELVCETDPSLPGLSTRTTMFVLLG